MKWVEEELADTDLGDVRLNRRLMITVANLAAHPTASVPEASGSWAATKGTYRLWDSAAPRQPASARASPRQPNAKLLIRATQNRRVRQANEELGKLKDLLPTLPVGGTMTVEVTRQANRPVLPSVGNRRLHVRNPLCGLDVQKLEPHLSHT